MNRLSKLFLIGILIFISTTTVYASDDDDYRGNRSKFYGTVEQLPAGLHGLWIVDGRQITVPAGTEIDLEHGRVGVGAYVEVEGTYDGREFLADEIEVKRGATAASADSSYRGGKKKEIYGSVEQLPAVGLHGVWIVDGRQITVPAGTEIDQEDGRVGVGAYVEIEGIYDDQEFHAYEIEVKQGATATSADSPDRGEVKKEIYGTVTRIPIGAIGTWVIDDQEIYVDENTRIEEKYGAAVIGAPVEIKGTSRGQLFHAQKIKVKKQRQ